MTNEEIVRAYQKKPDNNYLLQLYENNKAGLQSLCYKYKNYGDPEDFMQECYIALCEAAKRYDESKGMSFFSYWFIYSKALIIKYISLERGCSVSGYIKSHASKYKKYIAGYKAQNEGAMPTDTIICLKLGISEELLQSVRIYLYMNSIKSLDDPAPEGEDLTLSDTIASKEEAIENLIDKIANYEMIEKLWAEVDKLGSEASELIKLKHIEEMPLQDIAQKLGVNKNSINTLCDRYYRQLRQKQVVKEYAETIYAISIRARSVSTFLQTGYSQTEIAALKYLGAGAYHERSIQAKE